MTHLLTLAIAASAIGWQNPQAASPKVEPVTVGKSPNSTTVGGKLYFAGQPAQGDLEEYAKLGVKKVINLRMPAELEKAGIPEPALVKAAGMEYVNIPFGPEPPTDADLKKIFAELKLASPDNKVLLHCGTSNRVGLVWALYRGTEGGGLGVEEAVAEGRAAGLRNPALEKIAREKLAPKPQ
jgi:uncharacterized protein (TIGR01244 family)